MDNLGLDKFLDKFLTDLGIAVGIPDILGKGATTSNNAPSVKVESTSPKTRSSTVILDESDIDLLSLFTAFKNPENLSRKFIEHNKSFYNQSHSVDSFLLEFMRDYMNNNFRAPINPHKFVKHSFFYLFGIPVLIVDRLPWDNRIDGMQTNGRYSKVGIICVLNFNLLETARHEIMHAVVAFLKVIEKFKMPLLDKDIKSCFQDTDGRKLALVHIRDEIITYLTANPRVLSERSKDIAESSVSGLDKQKLQSVFSSDYANLSMLIERALVVDRGYARMYREKLCQILMFHTDCESIILSFNSHILSTK
jgi:hypothetical protein